MTSRLNGLLPSIFTALFVWLLFAIPLSIAAIEITFPFLLLAWLWTYRWPWNRAILSQLSKPERMTLLPLALYAALCTWSVAYSGFTVTTLRGLIGKLYEYILLFVIALFAARHPRVIRAGIPALLGAAWLVVLQSFMQEWIIYRSPFSTIHDPIFGYTLDYHRMVGPYKNPNDLATYLMVVGIVLIPLVFGTARRFSPGRFLLLIVVLGCLLWILSRGAFLGLLMGMGVLALFNWKDKRFITLLGGTLLVTVLLYLLLHRHRLWELFTLSDIGSKDRAVMWKTAWSMIRAKPLLGVGYNAFMSNYGAYLSEPPTWPAYAHNCFLQITAENGFLGLLSFLAFLFCLLLSCIRALWAAQRQGFLAASTQHVPFLIGLFAALCAFLVQSIFDTNLYALRQAVLFWTLSGLACGISGSILQKSVPAVSLSNPRR